MERLTTATKRPWRRRGRRSCRDGRGRVRMQEEDGQRRMLTLSDEKSLEWSSFFRKFHTKVSSLHFTVTVVTTWALLNIVESLCPNSLKIEFEIKDGPLRVSRLCRHRAVQQVNSLILLDSNIYDECLDEIRIPTVYLQGLTQVTGFGLQHILSEWLSGKRVIKLYDITARGYVSPSHLFHNLPVEHEDQTDSWTLRRGDEVLSVVANGHKVRMELQSTTQAPNI
ncbi:hypothetical protein ANCCAN_01160 [Ancylostoma caninum]|uniref:Uncharacterized protein n=1 Tax=Ancylostoma caninum TaxID=29170 RepID=A0A368H849_ANCCA|nr:hypothetical protein ANCCAN_01160 [Ancylostoma caninum]